MKHDIARILSILCGAETARVEGCRSACEVLSLDPNSTIASILVEKEQRGDVLDATLLQNTVKISEERNYKRNITDWPFENFWGNPHEPLHSKLLGYFLDPDEKHGCGSFLLQKLFEILKSFECLPPAEHRFSVDNCRVHVEIGHIDLWIERACDNQKFAVIFENKINWAVDQPEQLTRYVDLVYSSGFAYRQIYVFYLPLTDAKDPEPTDLSCIQGYGVNYKKITFETHILGWLNAVLGNETESEWPLGMREGMRDNLSHYRNLIRYLIQKQKEFIMDTKLLEQLRLAEEKHALPSLSDLETLKQSTEALQHCLKQAIRGKLLREMQALLQRLGVETWFCLEAEPKVKIEFESPYDSRFEGSVDLCLRVDDRVSVSFGGNGEDGFWIGYMSSERLDEQKMIEPAILAEAKEHLNGIHEKDRHWYAWASMKVTYYDKCVEDYSLSLVKTLLKMRDGLINRRKAPASLFA